MALRILDTLFQDVRCALRLIATALLFGAVPAWPASRPDAIEGRARQFTGNSRVMGEPLLRGREFTGRDRASSEPVVIVNQALARRYFANTDPIGRRIALNDPSEKNPWRVIVGVAGHEKRAGGFDRVGWAEMPMVLKPLAQNPPRSASLISRGSGADLRRAAAGIDERAPVGPVETMDSRLSRMLAYPRFRAVLLCAFAIFAVLLASIGLYGVLGQFVAQRTPEIGVRMAMRGPRMCSG